ncbi:hypothetical protein Tco_0231253 [Tanacetum coccineum]
MRNKPDIDEVDIDDLYNNLRVYEDELKRSSGSNSASQNLAFLSSENTNSTNEVSTANGDIGVSTARGINQVPSTPSAHDIAYSFLAQPTTSPQLENEDFQQMDGDDLEELDLQWQVAMLIVRVKNYHKKGILLENVDLEGAKEEDIMSNDFEVESVNYALMAISSSNSSSSSDRNPLTPSFDRLDEYAIKNKIIESKTLETTKTLGNINDKNVEKPMSVNEKVISKTKINRDKEIIEDWTSDDEEDMCLVNIVSFVKPKVTHTVRIQATENGQSRYLVTDQAVNGYGVALPMTGNKSLSFSTMKYLNGECACLEVIPMSFKLVDESQVILRAPRKDGVYIIDLMNVFLLEV